MLRLYKHFYCCPKHKLFFVLKLLTCVLKAGEAKLYSTVQIAAQTYLPGSAVWPTSTAKKLKAVKAMYQYWVLLAFWNCWAELLSCSSNWSFHYSQGKFWNP